MMKFLGYVAAMGLLGPAIASGQTYAVETKWTIGGEGGWDYLAVDAPAHRLYVTHGPRVEVIDTGSGKVVGALTGLKGTHGVVFDTDGKTVWVSDGGANAVVGFDKTTFAQVATVAAGGNPDGMVFEPTTKTVWAFNGRTNNATVIDATSRTVVATIPLPGKPEFPQTDGGSVFVNIEDKNEIVKLDAASKTATATWPLKGCESPSGLAIDTAGHHLFPVCDGKKMAVVDYTTGAVIATAAIGDGPDAAGFDPDHGVAFSSNGEGTLTVVDAKSFTPLQTVKTQQGGRTMAFDPGTGKVYVVVAMYGPRPAATAANPRPRPTVLPGSFSVLVIGRK